MIALSFLLFAASAPALAAVDAPNAKAPELVAAPEGTAPVLVEDPRTVDSSFGTRAPFYSTRVDRTISNSTIETELGPIATPIPLEIANFLLDHPDLTAYLVGRHKLAPYRIEMRGERDSWADDGEGTQGLVTLTQRSENRRVYYTEGWHDNLLLPRIHAEAVIIADFRTIETAGCPQKVQSRFHIYLRLKNSFFASLLKIVRPFARDRVNQIFTKAFVVARQVGILMTDHPRPMGEEASAFSSLAAKDKDTLRRMLSKLSLTADHCKI